jgi:hypothetical protein
VYDDISSCHPTEHKNLHSPAINVTKYSKSAYIAGIKVFNHLPLSIKVLATDTTSF